MRSSRAARVARALTIAASAAAPLACGSEPPPLPPPAPAPLDIATACAEYAAAHETAALCRSVDVAPPDQVPLPREQLRIRKLFEERCRSWLSAPGTRVTPTLLHACSARARAQCSSRYIFSRPAPSWEAATWVYCDLDIPGTLPDGAPCGDSTQCAGGLCDRREGCGTCVARGAVGELCAPYGCAKGAVCPSCKPKFLTPECAVGFRCGADVRAGEDGEACTVTDQRGKCARGLVCNYARPWPTCTPPGPPGARCADHADCRFDWCDHGVCADQSAEGGACASYGSCRPGLVCDTSLRCVPAPPASPKVPLGGKCSYTSACAPGSRCRGGTCILLARLGEACESTLDDPDCADDPFAECVNGTCQLFDPGACR